MSNFSIGKKVIFIHVNRWLCHRLGPFASWIQVGAIWRCLRQRLGHGGSTWKPGIQRQRSRLIDSGSQSLKVTVVRWTASTAAWLWSRFVWCLVSSGFPRGIESIRNCEMGFQDLEKVLNLAKMYVKYWKGMEIPNSAICLLIQILFFTPDDSLANVLLHCVPWIRFWKKEDKWWYWSFFFSIEKVWKKVFENVWEPCCLFL